LRFPIGKPSPDEDELEVDGGSELELLEEELRELDDAELLDELVAEVIPMLDVETEPRDEGAGDEEPEVAGGAEPREGPEADEAPRVDEDTDTVDEPGTDDPLGREVAELRIELNEPRDDVETDVAEDL
jgi:hypothetical protein